MDPTLLLLNSLFACEFLFWFFSSITFYFLLFFIHTLVAVVVFIVTLHDVVNDFFSFQFFCTNNYDMIQFVDTMLWYY